MLPSPPHIYEMGPGFQWSRSFLWDELIIGTLVKGCYGVIMEPHLALPWCSTGFVPHKKQLPPTSDFVPQRWVMNVEILGLGGRGKEKQGVICNNVEKQNRFESGIELMVA